MKDGANLLPFGGEAIYQRDIFPRAESDQKFRRLRGEIPWRQEPIKLFGRDVLQPRLTAWMAEDGVHYGYSGIKMRGEGWHPVVAAIRARAEALTGERFNGALLNFYRNGQDSMGWHRDNEKELGENPAIASVSFGEPRKFRLRLREDHGVTRELVLEHGSLLLMRGETQHAWEHCLPKTSRAPGPRINLTFRRITQKLLSAEGSGGVCGSVLVDGAAVLDPANPILQPLA